MNFSSPTFLFYFLPIFLILYWSLSSRFRPILLIMGSIVFYVWGDTLHFPIIAVLLILNFRLIQQMQKVEPGSPQAKRLTVMAFAVNICIVPAIKIFATTYYSITHIQIASLSDFTQAEGTLAYLPLGISFFTLQSLSVFIDIQKNRLNQLEPKQLNPFHYFLYMIMFPRVIAGPITRYGDISSQLKGLTVDISRISSGLERFIIGLAKKTIIADQLAPMVNAVFDLNKSELTTPYAWLGLIGFSLQLYFDFSGYTDMALGIGQMLGLQLPENFNFPYLATSITNFWRRWHISLSNWFRDYLFYPLERDRHGKSNLWRYLDILIVFFATGLWHGITINFVVWGLLHGVAIAYEISPLGGWLKRRWVGFQRLYSLSIIMLGWVFFRTASLGEAFIYLRALIGINQAHSIIPFEKMPVMSGITWIALVAGVVLCMPVGQLLGKKISDAIKSKGLSIIISQVSSKIALIIALVISIVLIIASSFQPTLYSRF
jgi:alginate O-acetyltransferase complex protein AlgI